MFGVTLLSMRTHLFRLGQTYMYFRYSPVSRWPLPSQRQPSTLLLPSSCYSSTEPASARFCCPYCTSDSCCPIPLPSSKRSLFLLPISFGASWFLAPQRLWRLFSWCSGDLCRRQQRGLWEYGMASQEYAWIALMSGCLNDWSGGLTSRWTSPGFVESASKDCLA